MNKKDHFNIAALIAGSLGLLFDVGYYHIIPGYAIITIAIVEIIVIFGWVHFPSSKPLSMKSKLKVLAQAAVSYKDKVPNNEIDATIETLLSDQYTQVSIEDLVLRLKTKLLLLQTRIINLEVNPEDLLTSIALDKYIREFDSIKTKDLPAIVLETFSTQQQLYYLVVIKGLGIVDDYVWSFYPSTLEESILSFLAKNPELDPNISPDGNYGDFTIQEYITYIISVYDQIVRIGDSPILEDFLSTLLPLITSFLNEWEYISPVMTKVEEPLTISLRHLRSIVEKAQQPQY